MPDADADGPKTGQADKDREELKKLAEVKRRDKQLFKKGLEVNK